MEMVQRGRLGIKLMVRRDHSINRTCAKTMIESQKVPDALSEIGLS